MCIWKCFLVITRIFSFRGDQICEFVLIVIDVFLKRKKLLMFPCSINEFVRTIVCIVGTVQCEINYIVGHLVYVQKKIKRSLGWNKILAHVIL